ncbi:hypothetical protein DAEQUDRAFT_770742 [Daedalea quercina L-15889]|uniref:Uncharacterized protein n=1 Tax=Daedalea quercina L-15889 TaxID=1314783 RepID=A0A165KLD0_9APHY|nr:hypothetical protein DAEQUDRAFT_770742 [Daedalea quercina L-15889]
MRASCIIPFIVAILSAAPALTLPLPDVVSYVEGLVYRDFPTAQHNEHSETWRVHAHEHGLERGTGAGGRHTSFHDARELVLAEMLARAIEESEDLYLRDLEEREYEEQMLWARGMANSEKKKIEAALDVMAGRDLGFTWGSNWQKAHNANTSQLGGYKPGSRKDSAAPHKYHVGIFSAANKNIQGKPLVEAEFSKEPTSKQAVDALVSALNKA